MNGRIEGDIVSFTLLKEDCLKTGHVVRHERFNERFASMPKDFMKSLPFQRLNDNQIMPVFWRLNG